MYSHNYLLPCVVGFVRFVDAKSAQRALEEYRDNEIVIQDVAVSVKVLKSEGLA